jgi:hypothetical protein
MGDWMASPDDYVAPVFGPGSGDVAGLRWKSHIRPQEYAALMEQIAKPLLPDPGPPLAHCATCCCHNQR